MKKTTIGGMIRSALQEGKSTDEVLAAVRKTFPQAQTTAASVAWYRSQMKKEAEGKQPTKKPAAKAAAATASAYTVGKFKSTQGIEGLGFIVTLYRGPTPVATAADYGNGGMVVWEWFDKKPATVRAVDYKDEPHEYKGTEEEALFWAHCLSLPKYVNDWDPEGGEHTMTPDLLVEELVNDLQLEKQVRRLTKGKVAFIAANGKMYTYKADPTESTIDFVRNANKGCTVLNGMPVHEAVALLKKHQH